MFYLDQRNSMCSNTYIDDMYGKTNKNLYVADFFLILVFIYYTPVLVYLVANLTVTS